MPRYLIRAPRFINGEFIAASPEFPVEIELPEGTKKDPGLLPVGSKEAVEKLRPHYVERDGRGMPAAPPPPSGKGKG